MCYNSNYEEMEEFSDILYHYFFIPDYVSGFNENIACKNIYYYLSPYVMCLSLLVSYTPSLKHRIHQSLSQA